ncbi:DNA internalization-related competence protein ComEC/Rec2 [Shewanella sp. SNU WT4]|uniref:DNA internalization-related competence protein ComEC/Rec2 n=1 Tax=Shewanella sp. SNU WT4 TaxID=2590015 RepID=UPI00112E2B12|nr:DNA internalization-related competence protein ComEC/Rec2 [Shewanella sp. SNU WT4]QDF67423.1 DNA internalization-related competence protein ComEC/Rec2 [Shewanella sp. SNU WT4]
MNSVIAGLCFGILSNLLWPTLPNVWVILGLLLIAGLCIWWRLWFISAALLGICYFSVYANAMLDLTGQGKISAIAQETSFSLIAHQQQQLLMDVTIVAVTHEANANTKFDVAINNHAGYPLQLLRLYWRNAPPSLSIGDIWRLDIKLKPMTSAQNEGGQNRQKLWLSQHIIAKGNVVAGARLAPSTQWRGQLIASLLPSFVTVSEHGLLAALLIGDTQGITQAKWQQLRQTGTAHLVAISGLHLSVVALWTAWLAMLICRRLWPSESGGAISLGLLLSLVVTFGYAWLSGLALPTQRALVMLIILIWLSLIRRYSSAWERWLWALVVVLIIDPMASLSIGLWLSFVAVAVILVTVSGQQLASNAINISRLDKIKTAVLAFWTVQWRLTLVLSLLQLFLFDGVSLSSLVMNALMVPWFSLVVIPLGLLALVSLLLQLGFFAIFSVAGSNLPWLGLLQLANASLWPFSQLLNVSDSFSGTWWSVPLHWHLPLTLAVIAGVCSYYCRGYWRYASLVALLPLIGTSLFEPALSKLVSQPSIPPKAESWQIHVVDVGQGTAVIVAKGKHALLYDTGSNFGEFSYASSEILPLLAAKGLSLDYLIVSHKDNDHAGGAAAIMAAFSHLTLITDLPWAKAMPCRGADIIWQGLVLEFLWPPQPMAGNHGSCVVRISDKQRSLLLTGDIDKAAELSMLEYRAGVSIESDILIAPHHGSLTSSSTQFIAAVNPSYVVYTAGFNNIYRFPHPKVVSRYANIEAMQLMTGHTGQLTFTLLREVTITGYRQQMSPFWYNSVFGFGDSQDVQ